MVYCYFDNNLEDVFNCEYEVTNDELRIDVDFSDNSANIFQESFHSGDKLVHAKTITIIDNDAKTYIKTFYAFENKFQTFFGAPFVRTQKSYVAKIYFSANSATELQKLDSNVELDNLMFFHECLDLYCINKSRHIDNDDEYKQIQITLIREENNDVFLAVRRNNIQTAFISCHWKMLPKKNRITIDYKNILKLKFKKRIPLSLICKYHDLMSCMFNLYSPTNTPLYDIEFTYQDTTYKFHHRHLLYKPSFKLSTNKKLDIDLDKFIESYLNNISIKHIETNLLNPFREKGKTFAEDTFLINYRFIECNLKKDNKCWLESILKENRKLINSLGINYNTKLHFFMETLRNHYAHEGYYIENHRLPIRKGNGKKKVVTDKIIIGFSRITKALAYKVMLNKILSLDVSDTNIMQLI